MKRAGQLFATICQPETLLAAYKQARIDKRAHRASFLFARNLGSNIHALHTELTTGTYQPKPCNSFWENKGRKPRFIEAPAFRDLVVQHAIYAVTSPIFERRYIDTCFACRIGKGTHQAANWLQAALRQAPRTAWVLHIDVRKFFYQIDRATLHAMLQRIIKCQPTLALMQALAHRTSDTGVPIGNLLSQTFANIYLSSLDRYCKRTLKIGTYARYMDDSIMLAPDRTTGLVWLSAIKQHLAVIGLQISHYSLHPIRKGANFVGFRTWASARFVRPHVIKGVRSDSRKGRIDSVISRLGHAKNTCSLSPILTYLEAKHHDLFNRLPQIYRLRSHSHIAPA